MQVVILAGGLGTRMLPFTETIPKPLLPVAGQPFLQHQIRLLENNDLHSYLLLTGHLGDQIEAHFGQGTPPTHVAYSRETQPLGTGGALANAADLLAEEFLLVNGDTYLDIDYSAFLEAFATSGKQAAIAIYPAAQTNLKGNIELDHRFIVSSYNKQQRTGTYLDAGVLAARKSVLSLIPPTRPVSFEETVFPALIARQQLVAWISPVPYFDMGTPEGLAALESHLA